MTDGHDVAMRATTLKPFESRPGVPRGEVAPILEHLGCRLSDRVDGDPTCVAEVEVREDLRNSGGVLQGGVIATLIDLAAGVTAARASGSDHVVTQDLHVHYLGAIAVGPARATATALRSGRRTGVVSVEVVDAGAEDPSRVCAYATATMVDLTA